MEKREGFVFYKSWFDSIKTMSDEDQLFMFRKIVSYGIGDECQLPNHLMAFWFLIQPQIDSNNKKYKDGSKGGRPKKTTGFENENHRLSENKPKDKVKDKEKDNNKEINNNFIEWFNKMINKHLQRQGKFKSLNTTDINNLKKLKKENYEPVDWEKAFISMSKNNWVTEQNMCNPSHFLRPDNFQRYVNQFEADLKPKFSPYG